jgi:hypothetical protein
MFIYTQSFELRRLQLTYELSETKRRMENASEGDRPSLEALCELLTAELDLHTASYPTDGMITTPEDGQILSLAVVPGEVLPKDIPAMVWVESGASLSVVVELSYDEGRPFTKGDGVSITLAESDSRRSMLYIQQKAYLHSAEPADNGGFRLYFPIQSESVREGDRAFVTMTKSLGDYGLIVPMKAILAPRGTEGYAYVTSTRNGLFGKETYVSLVKVEILAQNGISAAINVEDSLPPDAEFVLTTNKSLEPGGTVWIKREGFLTDPRGFFFVFCGIFSGYCWRAYCFSLSFGKPPLFTM